MGFEPKEREINGRVYSVVPFMAMDALKLKGYLIKIFGPSIGKLLGGLQSGENRKIMDAKIDGTVLAGAIESLFSHLEIDEFGKLVKRILYNTSVDIQSETGMKHISVGVNDDSFNTAFQERLLDMYKVIIFVLEVNYPDFFKIMKDFGNRITTPMSKETSKNTQTESKNLAK